MSEYLHVEKPFLDQLSSLGWTVIDQGQGMIPTDPAESLRSSFREWILPEVFRESVRQINLLPNGKPWLTDRQLDDLRDQILRQPNHNLLEMVFKEQKKQKIVDRHPDVGDNTHSTRQA